VVGKFSQVLAGAVGSALDRDNKVATPGNKYAKRLAKALQPLKMSKFNGRPLNAKVYLVTDVNAFAMDNGHSMFSSHPSSPDRAQRIQSRIDKDG
jgi:Zn-dependent protease with chaperone function